MYPAMMAASIAYARRHLKEAFVKIQVEWLLKYLQYQFCNLSKINVIICQKKICKYLYMRLYQRSTFVSQKATCSNIRNNFEFGCRLFSWKNNFG